jgi:hypothetical protein
VRLQHSDDEDSTRAPVRLRLAVWRRRARLDAALANGEDPVGDAALALRARQLTRLSTRRDIARTIRDIVDAADEPSAARGGEGPRPRLRRDAVFAARRGLVELADRLATVGTVPPQAAALAAALVWDSASPAYSSDADTTVARWVDTAIAALDAGSPT